MQLPSETTTLIWDLDGTLIDSYGVFKKILAEAAELSGMSVPEEQVILHNFHGSLDDSIYLIEHTKLQQYIHDVIAGDTTAYQKPDARILDNYNVDTAHTVMIGDQVVDAQFAANIGAVAVLINRWETPIPHLAALGDAAQGIAIVTSLNEVQF